jgi:DNA-binding MarR family transcriptional regulator
VKNTAEEARTLMELLNTLSLFTRKTMLEWLPDLVAQSAITSERFMVLYELMLEPDSSLKSLAEALMVSSSSLSVMINSMVEQGLVSRLPDPEDRRRVVLRLSEAGSRTLEEMEVQLVEKYRHFLEALEPDDREDLMAASGSMMKVVDRILNRS